jgi:hypothetical protein
MATGEKLLRSWSIADGLPTVVAGTVADAAAQAAGLVVDDLGAHIVTSADVDKIYRRLSDGSRWFLVAATPAPLWARADGYAWASRPYVSALPLDGNVVLEPISVGGAVAFTLGATTLFGQCYLRVTANGINTPTFATGFRELSGSDGYDNRLGSLNVLYVYWDGTEAMYSWSQPITQIDTIAPTFTTATVGTSAPNVLTIVMSEALDPLYAPASAFALTMSGGAVTVSAATISSGQLNLTLSRNISSGETGTVTYTKPGLGGIRDLAGNVSNGFTGTVSNTVATSAVYFRFLSVTSGVESGDAINGYGYIGANAGLNYNSEYCGNPSLTLAASAAGWWGARLNTLDAGSGIACILGWTTTSTPAAFGAYPTGIYANGTAYTTVTGGAGGGTPNGTIIAAAVGDIVRLRRSGTSMFAEVSKDSEVTWTLVHTWTGVSTGQLWPAMSLNNNTPSVTKVKGFGLS